MTLDSAVVSVSHIDKLSTLDLYNDGIAYLYGAENIANVRIYNDAQLHVYGYSLEMDTSNIWGYNAEMEWFQIHIRNSFVLEEHITLYEIPEPATLLLFTIGGLLLRSTRK